MFTKPQHSDRNRTSPAGRAARLLAGVPPLACLALAALAVGLSAASAGASSPNLVSNPSFEASLSGWAGNSSTLSRVPGGAAGRWSARVIARKPGAWSIAPTRRQVPSTVAGTVYSASASVRAGVGSSEVCLTLREWSGSRVVASAQRCLTPTSSRRTFPTIRYTARGTGNSIDLYAWGRRGSEGDAFELDAVSLTAGRPGAPPRPRTTAAPAPVAGCSVDTAAMTAPGCTIIRQDTAAASDPRAGLWGAIECAVSSRHRHVAVGGDPARRADGSPQGNSSFRSLAVVDGDNFYGQRCELGRNERRNGVNSGTQTNGAFGLYHEGERKITFFSQRYAAGFSPAVGTWQAIFQQKQAQPYTANGPVNGAPAIEIQIHGNRLHLASFWKTRWSTPAPRVGTWIRYALDVTYSANPSVGKMRLYVDLNGDGDFDDPGEVSPVIGGATLATAAAAGHGLNVGDPIPGHTRIGIYGNAVIPCPAPSGCQVDVDNIQIVK